MPNEELLRRDWHLFSSGHIALQTPFNNSILQYRVVSMV